MPAPASIQELSEANTKWGICGFVSAFAALHVEGKLVIGVPKEDLRGIFVYVIRKFLEGSLNDSLKTEIQTFTRTFPGFGSFTIEDFLKRSWNLNVNKDDFGIAMPPSGVIAFLNEYKLQGAREVNPPRADRGTIAILGLGTNDGSKYKGLKHWVYKCDGTNVYNWGKKQALASVMAIPNMGQVVYEIAF
jgi:hypothetical protein